MTLPNATLAFAVEGQPSLLRVIGLAGREELSSLFEIEVTLADEDEQSTPPPTIGQRASLHLTVGARTRALHGIVRSVEQGDSPNAAAHVRATIAPSAYVLALREDCRIFQGRRAPEIIESVLVAAGFTTRDYRFALTGTYQPREHCIQYRETDWAFLMRLLEKEGIFCFFDHEGDHEVLVFGDTPSAYARISEPDALSFRPGGGALESGEHVNRFRHVEELRPGSIALRGHSMRTPRATFESRRETKGNPVAVYDAPPELETPEQGERLARLRMEQEALAGGSARATSDCLGLAAGAVFALRDHACEPLNRDWLVTSLEHQVDLGASAEASKASRPGKPSDLTYTNRFTCVASDIPFRTKTRSPKPVLGIQTAMVVGPPGQDVHCDDLGRVKVQFHWDREGHHDDKSSSWIRVSQPWAGPGYGALFIPRVGHEVLVDFADGDIDRPIIVGSVYDGSNLPPASLPENRTATVLRSSSSPGNERFSELRLEALSGRELVHLESARDLSIRVAQDKDEEVARDERLSVGGDREREVSRDEKVAIGGDRDVVVAGSQTTNVGQHATTLVGGAHELEVAGDSTVRVTGQRTEVVGENLKLRVAADKSEQVVGSSREKVEGTRTLEAKEVSVYVDEKMRTRVGGDHLEQAEGTRRITAGEIIELVCGEATITANKDGSVTLVGKNVRVKVAGHIEIEGDKLSVKSEGAVSLNAGGAVKVRGRRVNLN